MERYTSSLSSGDVAGVVAALDEVELSSPEANPYNGWPLATHLLGLMTLWRLEDARFLWKRVPESAKTPDAGAAFSVLQGLWTRDYTAAWSAFHSFQWQGDAAVVAPLFSDFLRSRVVSLVERFYTTISASAAAALLGLEAGPLEAYAAQRGWAKAQDGFYGVPKPPPSKDLKFSEADLEKFAQYVLALDQ